MQVCSTWRPYQIPRTLTFLKSPLSAMKTPGQPYLLGHISLPILSKAPPFHADYNPDIFPVSNWLTRTTTNAMGIQTQYGDQNHELGLKIKLSNFILRSWALLYSPMFVSVFDMAVPARCWPLLTLLYLNNYTLFFPANRANGDTRSKFNMAHTTQI